MERKEIKTDMRWRSTVPDTIEWVSWGDDYVAYHRPSGTTHFLNASSAGLITGLLNEPKDAEAIAITFSPPVDDEDKAVHLKEILSMLERLEHLGMIQRARRA